MHLTIWENIGWQSNTQVVNQRGAVEIHQHLFKSKLDWALKEGLSPTSVMQRPTRRCAQSSYIALCWTQRLSQNPDLKKIQHCKLNISIRARSRGLLAPNICFDWSETLTSKYQNCFIMWHWGLLITVNSVRNNSKKSLNEIVSVTAIQICRSMLFINYYNTMDKVTNEVHGSGD